MAVAGSIKVTIESWDGQENSFFLDDPKKGLFIPKLSWHTMQYSHNAVQLVLASTLYRQEDYIRDYEQFKSFNKNS